MFVIQFNDGRTSTTKFKGEARLYAWISMEYSGCNVYRQGGCILLSPFDI